MCQAASHLQLGLDGALVPLLSPPRAAGLCSCPRWLGEPEPPGHGRRGQESSSMHLMRPAEAPGLRRTCTQPQDYPAPPHSHLAPGQRSARQRWNALSNQPPSPKGSPHLLPAHQDHCRGCVGRRAGSVGGPASCPVPAPLFCPLGPWTWALAPPPAPSSVYRAVTRQRWPRSLGSQGIPPHTPGSRGGHGVSALNKLTGRTSGIGGPRQHP